MEISTVVLIIVIIIVISYFLFFSRSFEHMGTVQVNNSTTVVQENILDPNQIKIDLATKLVDNFTDQLAYIDYLKMLTNLDNISNELIKRETFILFKNLKGTNNLTVNTVIEKINDI